MFAKDYGMAKLEKLCGESLAVAGVIDGKTALVEFLRMLGKTPVALLIMNAGQHP